MILNKDTRIVQDIVATSEGLVCAESNLKHVNLGEVINGDPTGAGYQIAAGAVVYSDYIYDAEWVRGIWVAYKASSASTCHVYVTRSDGTFISNMTVATGAIGASYNVCTLYPAILGSATKICIQNDGATANNFYAKAQLFG